MSTGGWGSDWPAQTTPKTYEQGIAEGERRERAAIVAYLRYQAEVFVDDERALCRAADDIEQGAQHTIRRLR